VVLPALAADELHVLVFGPGTGELVAVRAPPDDWLILDGCGVGRTKYGSALLEHYGVAPRLIALTHPHRDHAVGIADVVDAFTQGPASRWPRIGLLWPTPRDRVTLRDLQAYFTGGVVEDALSAIRDRWRRHPASRWILEVGSSIQLGEASILVASPERDRSRDAWRAWQRGDGYDPNQIATVLDVSWHGHHLILGSDLVEQPGGGWTAAQARCRNAVATKVPHHGSTNALHASWIRGEPHLAITPFASSNLPRFDPAGGIARMLTTVDRVHLTALPRAYTAQAGTPQRLTRRQLERLGDTEIDPPIPGWPDCYVILSIAADGSVRFEHGPGSVQVTESGARSRPRRRVVDSRRARS
jgi:beta-lactamase superfamily II metal-dependent hydrolase